MDSKEANWYFRYLFTLRYDDEWYQSLFRKNGKLAGDITPCYSILEEQDIRRIKKLNPDVKLIYALRNPVYRSWSSIRKFIHKNGMEANEHTLSTLSYRKDVFSRSNYLHNLNRYLKVFDRHQILILFFDELVENPENYLTKITSFLGLQPLDFSELDLKKKINSRPALNMPTVVCQALKEMFLEDLKKLNESLNEPYIEGWIRELEH